MDTGFHLKFTSPATWANGRMIMQLKGSGKRGGARPGAGR